MVFPGCSCHLLCDHFQFILTHGPNIPRFLCNIVLYSIRLYFHHQSHPQLGIVFSLALSLHSLWSYFPTLLQQRISHLLQSMEFSRPEYWSGQPFLSLGAHSNPVIKLRSPTLQAVSLPPELPGLVVKNLPCSTGDAGSIPGWQTKIPRAMGQLSPHIPQLERLSTTTKTPCSKK